MASIWTELGREKCKPLIDAALHFNADAETLMRWANENTLTIAEAAKLCDFYNVPQGVQRFRLFGGLTRLEVANIVGVDKTTVKGIEYKRIRGALFDALKPKFALALNIPVEQVK